MATIYETIKYWADGQNALNEAGAGRGAALQAVVEQALSRLQRLTCLADLAAAYYADEPWWKLIAQEFDLDPQSAEVVRNSAYWQRFMQLRHPAPRSGVR